MSECKFTDEQTSNGKNFSTLIDNLVLKFDDTT